MPYASCSRLFQAAPIPNNESPFGDMVDCRAALSRTMGGRWVIPATNTPRSIRPTSRDSAPRVANASRLEPISPSQSEMK